VATLDGRTSRERLLSSSQQLVYLQRHVNPGLAPSVERELFTNGGGYTDLQISNAPLVSAYQNFTFVDLFFD
jgi:hypothetical protein